jgi:MFS family permease
VDSNDISWNVDRYVDGFVNIDCELLSCILISFTGGIICGWVSDRGGRRLGFAIGSAISLLGVGLEYAANGPGMLLAGKIVRSDPGALLSFDNK